MRWSEDQLNRYYARLPKNVALSKAVEREAKLHEDIIAECKRRGWLWFHSPMHEATNRRKGEFDFEIAADDGRTFWIEAKAKGGKPSTDQLGVYRWLRRLGHRAHFVRSFKEFLEVVKEDATTRQHD